MFKKARSPKNNIGSYFGPDITLKAMTNSMRHGGTGLIESSVAVFVRGHKQLRHLLCVDFERPDQHGPWGIEVVGCRIPFSRFL